MLATYFYTYTSFAFALFVHRHTNVAASVGQFFRRGEFTRTRTINTSNWDYHKCTTNIRFTCVRPPVAASRYPRLLARIVILYIETQPQPQIVYFSCARNNRDECRVIYLHIWRIVFFFSFFSSSVHFACRHGVKLSRTFDLRKLIATARVFKVDTFSFLFAAYHFLLNIKSLLHVCV